MKLTPAIQESILAVLAYGEDTSAGVLRGIVDPSSFDPYFKDYAKEIFQYYSQFKTAPGEHLLDIAESLSSRKEDARQFYMQIYESILVVKDEINSAYVTKEAAVFHRYQTLRKGLAEAMTALEKSDTEGVMEAEAAFSKALKAVPTELTVGTFMSDTKAALSFLDRAEPVLVPLGIPQLDQYELGLRRGCLQLYLAPSNSGKSWWMVHLGTQAMLHRKKVLHVSLEMSEAAVAQRYVQNMFALPKRADPTQYLKLGRDSLGRFTEFNWKQIKPKLALRQPDIREKLMARMSNLRQSSEICIKQFPDGSLSMKGFESYLDSLEGVSGYIPDVILLDYADNMKMDTRFKRESITETFKQLRGLAVERNIAMSTPSQVNRGALDERTVTRKNVSEDINKINIADDVLCYSQTAPEKELGLARLFVDKARDDESGATVLISQNYPTGQYMMDACSMNETSYWNNIEADAEDSVD